MQPILFEWGPIRIFAYGFFLALAFLVGLLVARSEARRKGLDPDLMYDLVLLSAVGGIIGGRLAFALSSWDVYRNDPISIVYLWEGGLSSYGGIALAVPLVTVWARRKGLRWGVIADIAGLAIPLGIAVARIGCFLRGCCCGTPTNGPFGIVFPALGDELARHPTQLYELAYSMALFILLWKMRSKFTRDGDIFFTFLGGYGFFRFLNEIIRTNPSFALGLSGSQWASILAMAVAVAYGGWRLGNRTGRPP